MKIRYLFAVLAVAVGVAPLQAVDPIGHVIAVQGQATAVAPGGVPRPLKMKTAVFVNDRVATKAASKVQIMFVDDSMIAVGEHSEMVLDEYVYEPDTKGRKSSSTRLLKGVFRAITGKITDANPEGFRVKTSRATLGIRGCEVGFRLGDEADRVYVMHLPGKKRIVFFGEGDDVAPVLEVLKHGIMVTIGDDGKRRQSKFAARDAWLIVDQTTPALTPRDKGAAVDRLWPLDVETGEVRLTPGTPTAPTPPVPPPPLSPDPQDLLAQGAGTPPPVKKPPDGPRDPIPRFIPGGAGTDWSWGYWTRGSDVQSLALTTHSILPAADYQALARLQGITLYGDGDAAAIVQHAGLRKLLEGSVHLGVEIYAESTWWGTIDLANGSGDSLVLPLEGDIDGNGVMTAIVSGETAFQLVVNGVTFGPASVTYEDIRAVLLGAGTSQDSVTGAAGSFHLININGPQTATTDGIFATDLMRRGGSLDEPTYGD